MQSAGVLFFATESSVFWGGLEKLVGESQQREGMSLMDAMEADHCGRGDADLPFEARNYGTVTSSRVEWFFVARPGELDALDGRSRRSATRAERGRRARAATCTHARR